MLNSTLNLGKYISFMNKQHFGILCVGFFLFFSDQLFHFSLNKLANI